MQPSNQKITEFFDELASVWDETATGEGPVCSKIVSIPEIKKSISGKSVLNVGCGTGAFTQALIDAGADEIYGIDISPKMIEIAHQKFSQSQNVKFICDDIATWECAERFSCIVMYNCYPHLFKRTKLIQKTLELLEPNGRFVITHGAGRNVINKGHKTEATAISLPLQSADSESKPWEESFNIDIKIDSENLYVISGTQLL